MTRLTISASAAIAGFVVISASQVLGQGSLTPPGAPGPTFKTLQQVEVYPPWRARTPRFALLWEQVAAM